MASSLIPNQDNSKDMQVTKRSGKMESLSFDKILKRIRKSGEEVGIHLNYTSLAMKVIEQLYDKIPTSQIDELSAEQCYSMSSLHPDYAVIASRIIHSNHHSNTSDSFSAVITTLYRNVDKHGKPSPMVSDHLYKIVKKHKKEYDALCQYSRDFLIDYFGFKTLEKSYLLKINKRPVERIQHLWLRVALGIHGENMERVKETYEYMSQKYFIHATPTLFNAGTPHPQLSSCYLLAAENDSIDGIFNTLKDCAAISKWGGGIGLHIHNIRATGSYIRGTNGVSNGIVPMLRVFNNTAKYVDQCVLPETILYTKQGPKQIQHCVAGETQVFGLTGELETVGNVLEHAYTGELLKIKTQHAHSPLVITPEHPVYVFRGRHMEWIEAKDLDKEDMIAYSIPKDLAATSASSITAEDCYFAGILLGYGDMTNGCEGGNGSILLHTVHQKQAIDFLTDYFAQRMVDYEIQPYGSTTCFQWKRCIHLPFRYNDFYDESGKKRIYHQWLNLPIVKSKYILKGIVDYESCLDHLQFTWKNNAWNGDKSPSSLMDSVRFLCLKLGILTSGDEHILYIPKNQEICELFDLPWDSSFVSTFVKHESFLLSPIESIERQENYKGILYDLQMTQEHNYLLHHGLVHNGGGKRNGSIAIYLEPWHADIQAFLQMKKNHGEEELKARDLFYALWIPDLFMKRMKANESWTLMCPDECPGLSDAWGEAFETLYTQYEREGKGRETIPARDLWIRILDSQMETGVPYLLYKDTANRKSNQQNLGTIKSSNLCCEIMEYSDGKESAVCNLASIALPQFYDPVSKTVDYEKLHTVSEIVAYNLNTVIDVNFYPTEKTRLSNMRHRPIGIGVQGLADLFMMMKIPFDSELAKEINRNLFETIYHGALTQSCRMAQEVGPYETFAGSPASQGILQFDMWNVDPTNGRYDWEAMKRDIQKGGLRNSLLLAPMPTASTSQILGFNECFEPITSNIYSRGTLAGQFLLANKYLMRDLIDLGVWNEQLKRNIIANDGSVQNLDIIPEEIRKVYRTVYEIPMKSLIDMAVDRGAFICQSQSLNLWLEDPDYKTLTSMHYYAWQKGLKTGIYYLRRRGKHQAQKFTIEPERVVTSVKEESDICDMCSA